MSVYKKLIFGILLGAILLFVGTLKYELTELDDAIFYRDFHSLLSKWKNLPSLFSRGVFTEHTDTYYRPVLMASFLFDQASVDSLKFSHAVNILLHLTVIGLLAYLFQLWMRWEIAAGLVCLFAVHPIAVPVVAWIPGRNDSLLTIFMLIGIISIYKWEQTKRVGYIVLYLLALLLALFTKETAVVLPLLGIGYVGMKKAYKSSVMVFLVSLPIGLIWYWARQNAIQPEIKIGPVEMVQALIHNIGLPIQSIGKMLLPFNLSVFPMIADTSYLWGNIALLSLMGLSVFCFQKRLWKKEMVYGLFWMFVALGPLLLVPASVNEQTFEHRLYFPMIGLFICIGVGLSAFEISTVKWGSIVGLVTVCFLFFNIRHQAAFKNEITFWKQAVTTTPHSSYAHKMMGVKWYVKKKKELSEKHIRKALALDSTERYANYYLGKHLMDKEQWAQAEYYMLKEEQLYPGFFDTVFDLARVYYEKKEMEKVPVYLDYAIRLRPTFMQAKNNLLVYYKESNQLDKLSMYIQKWKQEGTGVPPGFEDIK